MNEEYHSVVFFPRSRVGGFDATLKFPGLTQDLLDETTTLVCVLNRTVALTRKSSVLFVGTPIPRDNLKRLSS